MNTMPVAWITHPDCLLHQMEEGHPESPLRLHAIQDRLMACGIDGFLLHAEAPEATPEQLQRVHTAEHVRFILNAPADPPQHLDPDTLFMRHTRRAALRAAGSGVQAVDMVLGGKASLAFCAVRPPGHHAERARAMGFCFFNNVAVAAAHALSRGLERVAILDFDVHYGNGTADIFQDDPRVLLCSTYGHPLYPYWAGSGDSASLIDVPLSPYSAGTAFRAAVTEHWLPALERFQPQMLLVSAGFDAHGADPLGNLRLGLDDYRWLGRLVQQLAEQCCEDRVVAMLEGGYDLTALARSVEAFLEPFMGGAL
ncbi:histone deacetylase family protein [Solimonas sp. SE-A11]|nr:histone deacetylase family protein [Solimonas sp. SE-A11]MDM4769113.1 histone deacetylase family protein [Solimonas sp. SE-A11]